MDRAGLEELFAPLGLVTVRRMFSGHGVFADGLMFALEVGGTVYLKVDDATAGLFEERGCEPFSYARPPGRRTVMSYRRVPEEAFDDPDVLLRWARIAREAAFRAARPRGGRLRPRSGSSAAGPLP